MDEVMRSEIDSNGVDRRRRWREDRERESEEQGEVIKSAMKRGQRQSKKEGRTRLIALRVLLEPIDELVKILLPLLAVLQRSSLKFGVISLFTTIS